MSEMDWPCVEPGFILPQELTNKLMRRLLPEMNIFLSTNNYLGKLTKLCEGIWWCLGGVPMHTDGNHLAIITTGLVLIGPNDTKLFAEDQQFDLPVGAMYRIDGSKLHGTKMSQPQLFCFMAWDCPVAEVKPIKTTVLEMVYDLALELG